jgi:hypothetical protein
VILPHITSSEHVLVIGRYGPSSLMKVTQVVAGTCGTVAACGWAWRIPHRTHPLIRTGTRTLAVVSSLTILIWLAAYAWLTAIGGSARYVDVGTLNGHTITVAEYSSLGGTNLQLGERDGWYFTPNHQPEASANSNHVPGGPPPSQRNTYKLHVDNNRVTVDYDGPHPLTATFPGCPEAVSFGDRQPEASGPNPQVTTRTAAMSTTPPHRTDGDKVCTKYTRVRIATPQYVPVTAPYPVPRRPHLDYLGQDVINCLRRASVGSPRQGTERC